MTHTFAIISAERASDSTFVRALRTDALKTELHPQWTGTFPVNGAYKGAVERAFLVPLLPWQIDDQLARLLVIARRLDQESILYVAPDSRARLYYSDGRMESLGRWVEVDERVALAESSYTFYTSVTCGTRYFITRTLARMEDL